MKLFCLTFLLSAFPLSAGAQSPEASPEAAPLTDQRIVELVRAGVHSDELARMIATAPQVSFDLTPTGTDAMMKAGVSEETIKAMAAREQIAPPSGSVQAENSRSDKSISESRSNQHHTAQTERSDLPSHETVEQRSATISETCPIEIEKVNPAETAWNRVVRTAMKKDQYTELPPDFIIKFRNSTAKDIRGLKFIAAYYDATEDLHLVPEAWNAHVEVNAGAQKVVRWDNLIHADTASIGWVVRWDNLIHADTASIGWVVIAAKVLFEDGSMWRFTESTRGCYGEYWRNRRRPSVTGPPDELIKKAITGESD